MKRRRVLALLLALVMLLGIAPSAMAFGYYDQNGEWVDLSGYTNGQGWDPTTGGPVHQHNYQVLERHGSCTEWGLVVYRCSECGDTYEEDLAPLGHNWGPWIADAPANCVQHGTHYHQCQRCGEKEWERDYASGLGDHDWGPWETVKEPSPEGPGIERRVCKIESSHVEEREIPYVAPPTHKLGSSIKVTQISPQQDVYYAGDEIRFEIIVTNVGDCSADFLLYAFFNPADPDNSYTTPESKFGPYAPGESKRYEDSYIVTEFDASNGYFALVGFGEAYRAGNGSGIDDLDPENPVISGNMLIDLRPESNSFGARCTGPTLEFTTAEAHEFDESMVWLDWSLVNEGQKPYKLGSRIDIKYTVHNDGATDIILKTITGNGYNNYDDYTGWGQATESTIPAGEALSYDYTIVVTSLDIETNKIHRETANTYILVGQEPTEDHSANYWTNYVYPEFDFDEQGDGEAMIALNWDLINKPEGPYKGGETIEILLRVKSNYSLPVKLTELIIEENCELDEPHGWGAVQNAVLFPYEEITYPYSIVVNDSDLAAGAVVRTMHNEYAYTDQNSGEQKIGETNIVQPYFEFETGGNTDPSLMLELTLDPDAGVGQRFVGGAVIATWKVTNNGNCDLYVADVTTAENTITYMPGSFVSEPKLGGANYILLHSGEYFVFDELYVVAEENVQSGTIQVAMGANAAYFKNDTEWEYVASNSIYEDVPLTLDEVVRPSLSLSVSVPPDAGVGKRYYEAQVGVDCVLTNTSSVDVYIPAYGDLAKNVSSPSPWEKLSDFSSTVTRLGPGQTITYTLILWVTHDEAESGIMARSWDDFGWWYNKNLVEVCNSNVVYFDIPLTGDVPPTEEPWPELTLYVTQYDPAGQTEFDYPDPSNYDEVWYRFRVVNTGNMPVRLERIDISHSGGTAGSFILNMPCDLDPNEEYINPDYTCSKVLYENMIIPGTASENYAGEGQVALNAYGVTLDDTMQLFSNQVMFRYKFRDPAPDERKTEEESALLVYKHSKYLPGDSEGYQLGEEIIYVLEVYNPSNVTVPVAKLTDDLVGTVINIANIEPGQSYVYEIPYTVTLQDVADGYIYNEAWVEWDDPVTGDTKLDFDDEWLPVTSKTGLLVQKRIVDEKPVYYEGDEITFELTFINNSNEPIYGVDIYDDLLLADKGSALLFSIAEMSPGQKEKASFKYKVTEMDVIGAGYVMNYAYGYYDDLKGIVHEVYSNDVYAELAERDGPILNATLKKEVTSTPKNGEYYQLNEEITYKITLKNTGTIDIDAFVADSLKDYEFGLIGDALGLKPGEEKEFPFSHIVTQYDVDNRKVINYATAQYRPTTSWMTHTVTSNKVTSDTNEKTDTIEIIPPIRVTKGDCCERELLGIAGNMARYSVHLCGEHVKVEQAVEELLESGAADAWQQAYKLWQAALDDMYEQLLDAATDEARVTVLNDRMNYYLWLGSYEKVLNLIYPDAPETVAEKLSDNMMERCVDLCWELHTAPEARKDTMVRKFTERPVDVERTGRETLKREGGTIEYVLYFGGKLSSVLENVVKSIDSAATRPALEQSFLRAQRMWQMELDSSINARYKAASKEDRQIIAMNRKLLDQMIAARKALLELLYPVDAQIVAERISTEYMNNAVEMK